MVADLSEDEEITLPTYIRRSQASAHGFFKLAFIIFTLHVLLLALLGLLRLNKVADDSVPVSVELISWGAESSPQDNSTPELLQHVPQVAHPQIPNSTELKAQVDPEQRESQDSFVDSTPKLVIQPKSPPRKPSPKLDTASTPQPTQALEVPKAKERTEVDNSPNTHSASSVANSDRDNASINSPVTGLDRGPKPLANAKPPYPREAYRAKLEGQVVLNLEIAEDGSVNAVELLETSGVDSLDQAALKASKDWRYSPAIRSGKPISQWIRIAVKFELKSAR